jgi:hypothetical protein
MTKTSTSFSVVCCCDTLRNIDHPTCIPACPHLDHRQCRDALTTRQKLIAQDYRVSYSLAKACKADLRKQHCNLENNLPRAREARLSYLLLCLESAVHRGECCTPVGYSHGVCEIMTRLGWCVCVCVCVLSHDGLNQAHVPY